MKRIITIILVVITTISCSAQNTCEQLQALKKQYYGFTPSNFTQKEKEERSAGLDKFWEYAKANKPQSLECLKDMILAENNDPYFCFDASSLLLQMDDKQQYLDVILKGVGKCKLKDLDLEPYLKITCFLGIKGKDISTLTEKFISEPNAKVFLTEHVITLSAIDASLFIYNIMGTDKAESFLFKIIKDGNSTGKHNAAVALNLLSTNKGDSLINHLIETKQLADSTIKFILSDRKQFTGSLICNGGTDRNSILQQLKGFPGSPERVDPHVAGNDDFICSACKNLTPKDADVVRAARDKSTPGPSDEALYDYFALTKILMTVRNKPQ
jgi:hypothetical protein